jgi:phosphoenolpyruvate synthase/pyruvate phosphate dikinase
MEWVFIVKRDLSVLFYEFITLGQTKKGMKEILGLDTGYDHYRSIYGDVGYSVKEMDNIHNFFKSEFSKKGAFFFVSLLEKWKKLAESLIGTAVDISKKDLSTFSDKELLNEFDKLSYKYYLFSSSLMAPLNIEKLADEFIKARLSKEEHFLILTTPERETDDIKELKSMLKIAAKIEDRKLKLDKKDKKLIIEIEKHINEFGWINTRGFYGNAWTVDEIFMRLKDLLNGECKRRLSELEEMHKEVKKKSSVILKEINAGKDLIDFVKVTKEFVAFRTDRMDAFVRAGFIARPLFKEMAKRLNLDLDDFFNLTTKEIKSAFKGKDYSKILKERRKGFGYILNADKITVISGKELEEYKKKYCKEEIKETNEIKGTVANKGYAKGIVKVLHTKSDIHKIEKGNILVISMTTPDYISAMEKAAAFVTDEGGILCHAAIIGREMNKPCIIGTKIATKIFKDGDLVEVDADKGVVKVINRK